jgi:hypothetical protein
LSSLLAPVSISDLLKCVEDGQLSLLRRQIFDAPSSFADPCLKAAAVNLVDADIVTIASVEVFMTLEFATLNWPTLIN